jgi:hypothetical protein
MNTKCKLLSAGAASLLALASTCGAQTIFQWDFENGNLGATLGLDELLYADGPGGATEMQTVFGTTTTLGIPDINGVPAKVMCYPAASQPMGFSMPTTPMPNGPTGFEGLVNDWTLILDVLYSGTNATFWRAIIQTDGAGDADFFIDPAGAIGIAGQYQGQVRSNTWHRIGFVADGTAGQLRKYIDGVLVGVQSSGGLDGRWALVPGSLALILADNDGENAAGYVNSIQLRDVALATPQMGALGGPNASGIPEIIPPIPSFVERWIPAGSRASPSTDLGAVVFVGDSFIPDESVVLRLDGQVLANPQLSRDAGRLTVLVPSAGPLPAPSDHVLELVYEDDLASLKTNRHSFRAVLFYEDFEKLELGPNLEEGLFGMRVWTSNAPPDWVIDSTGVPGFGDPGSDGVTEWAGWSFADREWWAATAGDQNRSLFTKGIGAVAIADPDEWDDAPHAPGHYNAFLTTPDIPLGGAAPRSAFLALDSSWRPECCDDGDLSNNQTATIAVSYDNGPFMDVLVWDSMTGSPTFHPDAENESITVPLNNPAGATSMKLRFGLTRAANDWWWAFDNLAVDAGTVPPTITQQPTSLEVTEGEPATFRVVAEGGQPLFYHWFKGAGAGRTVIPGAESATFTIPQTTVADTGVYSCQVSNSAGVVFSSEVQLIVQLRLGAATLLCETFDSLPLGPNMDEALAGENVWTKTGPMGWTIDDSGVPGAGTGLDGVTEWAGWSFANRVWWATTAGDQQRSLFTKGRATVAIADGDEWDDQPREPGQMTTYLSTPAISLQGIKSNSVVLKFDSSWRDEEPQKVNIRVSFDGGAPVEVLRWESAPASPFFHNDAVSETVTLRIDNPAGSNSMVITFGYLDAGNNWWWAIDNVLVTGEREPLFAENFDGLPLGPNVDEALAGANVWTKTPPSGWMIDDTRVPGVGTPEDGVTEWAGWSFADRVWWATTAGDQQRSQFTKGTGTIAVADSDEWDDVPHAPGNMATFLSTPAISLTGVDPNSLVLRFDSSWRDEEPQKANITASFDGGAAVEILRWESAPASPFFHNDAVNETVTVNINNPPGVNSMVLKFGYFDTRNNWWWAIDNIQVTAAASRFHGPLAIRRSMDGLSVELNWPGSPCVRLQRSATVGPANWQDVPGSEGASSAVLPIGAGNEFFRLIMD